MQYTSKRECAIQMTIWYLQYGRKLCIEAKRFQQEVCV